MKTKGDRTLLLRGAARTPSRSHNRGLLSALSPVLVKSMADSWLSSLFQRLRGGEGSFLAATCPAVISGSNTVLEGHEEKTG